MPPPGSPQSAWGPAGAWGHAGHGWHLFPSSLKCPGDETGGNSGHGFMEVRQPGPAARPPPVQLLKRQLDSIASVMDTCTMAMMTATSSLRRAIGDAHGVQRGAMGRHGYWGLEKGEIKLRQWTVQQAERAMEASIVCTSGPWRRRLHARSASRRAPAPRHASVEL